jgi:soluble lytic murein transglycosylase-like protein
MCVALLLAVAGVELQAQIPLRAAKYKRSLRRQVNAIWGIDQPLPVFAAQIQAESAWRPLAESPYARGLGQQTPNTERWLNEMDAELARMGGGALNPYWSIRALVFYDRWLWQKFPNTALETDRWAFALASYNCGLGWVYKERDANFYGCDNRHYPCVRLTCLRSREGACNETARYVPRILFEYKPWYEEAGW